MLQSNNDADNLAMLDLKRVFQEEGLKLDFEKELDFSGEELYGDYPFSEPVRVTGTVENQNCVVMLRCRCEFRYSRECDRCLDPTSADFILDFEHIVSADNKEDEEGLEELAFAPDFRLELYELLREDIFLEIPGKFLCRQECKGLCPKCGCNLNHSQCNCDLSNADPRLAALGGLIDKSET